MFAPKKLRRRKAIPVANLIYHERRKESAKFFKERNLDKTDFETAAELNQFKQYVIALISVNPEKIPSYARGFEIIEGIFKEKQKLQFLKKPSPSDKSKIEKLELEISELLSIMRDNIFLDFLEG